jgi:beta-glucosidase
MGSGNNSKSVESKSHGRTYRYFDGEVLYPFGYGLSYTTFEYSNLRLSKDKICIGDTLKLYIDVKNTGKITGEEVVQLYVKGNIFNSFGAIKSLKGFERVSIKPNQTKTIEFQITASTLEEFKEKGFVVEKGEHILMLGPSSRNSDLKEIKLVVE